LLEIYGGVDVAALTSDTGKTVERKEKKEEKKSE